MRMHNDVVEIAAINLSVANIELASPPFSLILWQ